MYRGSVVFSSSIKNTMGPHTLHLRCTLRAKGVVCYRHLCLGSRGTPTPFRAWFSNSSDN